MWLFLQGGDRLAVPIMETVELYAREAVGEILAIRVQERIEMID